jgi:hypothetical protein
MQIRLVEVAVKRSHWKKGSISFVKGAIEEELE